MGRLAGSTSSPQFLAEFVCFARLGLCPRHAAEQKSLQEGNPALKKLIVIQNIRNSQTPVPTLVLP